MTCRTARMIAPSILASSESRCGVNSASSRNPPEQTDSTSGPSPTTISAPMRAWRMRSRPSRSCVPGATSRRATIMASDRGGAGTMGSTSRCSRGAARGDQDTPGRAEASIRRISPAGINASSTAWRTSVTSTRSRPAECGTPCGPFGDHRAREPEARRLGEPAFELGHGAHLAAEAELTDRDGVAS